MCLSPDEGVGAKYTPTELDATDLTLLLWFDLWTSWSPTISALLISEEAIGPTLLVLFTYVFQLARVMVDLLPADPPGLLMVDGGAGLSHVTGLGAVPVGFFPTADRWR